MATVAESSTQASSDLTEGFNNLNLARQAGLMVGLAASVALGFAVVLWSQGEDYRPLYSSLDRLDSREVIQILEYNNIPFKVDSATGAMMVADGDINQARLKLAEAGLPGDKSLGFELLQEEQPLGTSQFMENARYRRSVEGELARTISSINSVRHARVHLAIPKRSVFVRDVRKSTASVMLELFPGRTLKPSQVKAVANLVAASIPELKIKDVAVLDQKGNLLSAGDENPELKFASKQREYTRKLEADIADRVNRILQPVIGSGRYRTEVSADVDFNAVERAEETFNPDLPAIRSEQTLDEQRVGGGFDGGIPGALSNQPPQEGAAPEEIDPATGLPKENAAPSKVRKQSTRNYELDRTVSYTKQQIGRLMRLSVAVVVDDKKIQGADGSVTTEPWSENELARLSILVRDAAGFSAARGDSLNVLNTPFFDEKEDFSVEDIPIWQQDIVMRWIKPLAGALIVMVLLFGVLRPLLKSLATTGVKSKADEEAREMAALEEAGLSSFDSLSNETVTLTGGDALALPSPEESYEQQVNAVKGMIAEDPGRVAQVIKSWVASDE